MGLDQKAVLGQIDSLLGKYDEARSRSKHEDISDLPEEEPTELLTRIVAAIERLSPPGSRYVKNSSEYMNKSAVVGYKLTLVVGVLKALRADYEAGFLQSITELIHTDLFGDFLEMADHLLEQKYKDPSAVIAGSVLEEHLRKLCDKNGISTDIGGRPKKADAMNAELATAIVYSKLDQKSITAWLDLRNKAAHGEYGKYTQDQVALLVQGIRDFISRNPA
jgi:hypothetical protein